ncbi:hypothetical protein H2203_001177 [Taxawa tesnikishii (nom. ined.)]|nr:hypothetical protein H2203_001177 [Dothideales sp. JES 119]
MSKERIFKIRQKAVKLLAKAYTLDEVAASVATMQSTSSLEEVAIHVQKRDKADIDAQYVQFFHEKIPSRMMEHYTPLEPLTDIIVQLPFELQGAPLRTRALVQIFKGQYEGAANDLTIGLRIAQELKIRHKPGADQLILAREFKKEQENWNRSSKDWRQVPQLREEDQPSSLEQQMLFNRAGVYLTIACQNVHAALDGFKDFQQRSQSSSDGQPDGQAPPLSTAEKQAHQIRLDARKKVKTYAKRALKDYLAFLEQFDYTPGLPFEVTNEIMRRVYDLANGNKTQTPIPYNRLIKENDDPSSGDFSPVSDAVVKHQRPNQKGSEWDADGWPRFPMPQIYPASALFAATPPSDLPTYPDPNAPGKGQSHTFPLDSREAVTYHPLLTDAVHSLLLAHALVQTSSTELLRHAHNAARLARIADGYPIFQAARSPARADWIEVLRRANNWIAMSASTIAHTSGGDFKEASTYAKGEGDEMGSNVLPKKQKPIETEDQKRERRKQEAILDALADERVVDEESFQRAVRAREKRAIEDEEGLSGPLRDRLLINENGSDADEAAANANGFKNDENVASGPKRWAQDDGKEYPISTDRADAIARWIREAPLSMGVKKKRRPARKALRSAAPGGLNGVAEATRGSMPDADEEEVD